MKTNEVGINLIKSFESFSSKPYLCPAGRWTLGWGSTYLADGTPVTKDTPSITRDQADALLLAVLPTYEAIVAQHVKVSLSSNQFSALVSFVFNVGPGKKGVKDGFVELVNGQPSTMLRKLNAGDYTGAAEQFMSWNKGGGVVLAGLTRRRGAEKALFLS